MKKEKPLIYLITDGSLDAQSYSVKSTKLIELIEVAVNSGIALIQLREKNLPAHLLFQLTSEIVKISKNSNTKILVNDRADVALAAKADGVHLTSTSIPTKIIRQNFPKHFIIGVSTHTLEEAAKAKNEGADFVVFAPIFDTPNKGAPQGVERAIAAPASARQTNHRVHSRLRQARRRRRRHGAPHGRYAQFRSLGGHVQSRAFRPHDVLNRSIAARPIDQAYRATSRPIAVAL